MVKHYVFTAHDDLCVDLTHHTPHITPQYYLADNTFLPESDEQFNIRVAQMRKIDLLEREKKKKKKSHDQNFAETNLNSKMKKFVDIEETIFTARKDSSKAASSNKGREKGSVDGATMSGSDDSSDSGGSVNYFTDSDEGMEDVFATTPSNTQPYSPAQKQRMKDIATDDRVRDSSHLNGYARSTSTGLTSNKQHSAYSRDGSGINKSVGATKGKGYRDNVERERDRAYDKAVSRDKQYTSIYSGLYKSRDKKRSDGTGKSRYGDPQSHAESRKQGTTHRTSSSSSSSSNVNGQALESHGRAATSDVIQASRTGGWVGGWVDVLCDKCHLTFLSPLPSPPLPHLFMIHVFLCICLVICDYFYALTNRNILPHL